MIRKVFVLRVPSSPSQALFPSHVFSWSETSYLNLILKKKPLVFKYPLF